MRGDAETHKVIGLFSVEKLVNIARFAGLAPGDRVIDFGCGFGENLIAWSERYGISGFGIDAGSEQIEFAQSAIKGSSQESLLEFVHGDATDRSYLDQSYDLAACITATNMFGRADVMFRAAIRHMKEAIKDNGYLLIAEPYYNNENVPDALIEYEGALHTEQDLIDTISEEGFELVYLLHSSRDEWDRYISSNLYHMIRHLQEHPDDLQRESILTFQKRWQDMYVSYRKKYQECAAFLMTRL